MNMFFKININKNLQLRSIGSFRPSNNTMHLNIDFNFIEIIFETVGRWLLHSSRTLIKSQGILLLYDGQVYHRYLQRITRESIEQTHLIIPY